MKHIVTSAESFLFRKMFLKVNRKSCFNRRQKKETHKKHKMAPRSSSGKIQAVRSPEMPDDFMNLNNEHEQFMFSSG